jgi:hypothetical protein
VLKHLGGRKLPVALIGVSPMTRRCANLLARQELPLLIVNRSPEAAAELARTVAGQALSLEAFRRAPPEVHAVVLAAGGGEPVLDEAALSRLKRHGAPLIIDFGVPPTWIGGTARQRRARRHERSDRRCAAAASAADAPRAGARHRRRLTHLRTELAAGGGPASRTCARRSSRSRPRRSRARCARAAYTG